MRWPTSSPSLSAMTPTSRTRPFGEIEHLGCTGIEYQLLDVFADELLRADSHVDRYRVLREQVVGAHVFRRANAGDLRRRVEQRVGDLAGDHVGLVGVGQRDDDVRIVRAGAAQNFRIGGVADHGADVETVLQFPQHVGAHVDDRDFVGFLAGQVIRGRRTDLTCTEY